MEKAPYRIERFLPGIQKERAPGLNWRRSYGLRAAPPWRERTRRLVLIRSEVRAAALRAGFSIDVRVYVLLQVADNIGRQA